MYGTRAAGLLLYRDAANPEFLLLKASYSPFHWSPPKGLVDGEEEWYGTALREVAEETGYAAADIEVDAQFQQSLTYVAHGKQKESRYWLARLRDATKAVTLSDEHTEYRWLLCAAAGELAGFADMTDLFKEATQHINA